MGDNLTTCCHIVPYRKSRHNVTHLLGVSSAFCQALDVLVAPLLLSLFLGRCLSRLPTRLKEFQYDEIDSNTLADVSNRAARSIGAGPACSDPGRRTGQS